MSLLRNHTGFQFYPLSAGSNDNPTVSQTSPTTFELKNVPLAVGSLPYYVYGALVTFYGEITQTGAGVLLDYWKIVRSIVDSLEVRNAWHGTPVGGAHVKGSMLQVIEPVSMGYALPQVTPGPVPAGASGPTAFEITVYVPLSIGQGEKPHHTAQLALLYKQAQIVITPALASVLTALSPGATFTNLSARASAMMLPEPELRLGPVGEWIDYQSGAAANQSQIALDSFGNITGISGTLPNAGVLWMGALTNAGGMPGSFGAQSVTKYSFPFRGQVDIMQIEAFITQQLMAHGGADFAARSSAANRSSLYGAASGFPYNTADGAIGNNNLTTRQGLLFFPMASAAADLELTKIQTAKGTQSYFLAGPTFSGVNHTLVQHVRSFDDNKREDFVRQVVDSGLAKLVLGRSTKLAWAPKLTKKNDSIDPEKLRYLPFRLVREEKKQVIAPR